MKLGSSIKKCRQIKGLTLESLANKTGLSKSYLSLVESDKRGLSIEALTKVSGALAVPMQLIIYLASETNEIEEMDESLKVQFDRLILNLLKNA